MTSVLCIGDFGTGDHGQYKVADLLKYLIEKYKSKFVIGLGDNIYPDGVSSIKDKQFIDKFEIPYLDLPKKIKFYNILGNHDYVIKKSPISEIKYSNVSNRWIMPHNFYCFRKTINNTSVDFIAIDTNLSLMKNKKLQEQWVLNTILESKARWIIVFGHHPWKSYGGHGNCDEELNKLYKKISNLKKVDLLLAGHDHSKQHIFIPDKPNMIVCGVGSMVEPNIKVYNDDLKYVSNSLGCAMIEFSKKQLKIGFFNTKMEQEYKFIINKI